MRFLALTLSIGSVFTGLVAAFLWFLASQKLTKFDSSMIAGPDDLMDLYWKLRVVHDDGFMAAKLNRAAALWTAASVLLAGGASLASSLQN